ncbi:hypothetical protein GCM10023188_18440 [Pontibacter saemangeumensis]|uniref:Three-Cys-motif partner protein n=1 Tax=Pontibacter saemangeumensis TaxID=1084525 RepID=A0ABP8LMC6_9BACT
MTDTAPNPFFQEPRSFAEVKQELLPIYFEKWCGSRMATADEPLLFVDLHAAAGQEQQAQQAAPPVLQRLLRSTLKTKGLPGLLRFFLNDSAKAGLAGILEGLEQLPACEELSEKPLLLSNFENRALLNETLASGFPALLFMDPFSYGFAQEMLLQACNASRSDLLLLLSPASILRAFTGRKVSQTLVELFEDRLSLITAFCRKEKHPGRRQEYILQHLQSLLREKSLYTLLFTINQPGTDSPSHYVLFCSPDVAVYDDFKLTVLPYSGYQPDGVPLFLANQGPQHQLSLFEYRPAYAVAQLVDELASGQAQWKFKSVGKIYELHSPNTPYIPDNYLAAFELLRDREKVVLLNGKTMQTVRKPSLTSVVKYIS